MRVTFCKQGFDWRESEPTELLDNIEPRVFWLKAGRRRMVYWRLPILTMVELKPGAQANDNLRVVDRLPASLGKVRRIAEALLPVHADIGCEFATDFIA